MKLSLNVLLLLLALICFAIKFILGLVGGSSGKIDLDALGMTFLVAAFLFG
jgi:hypothetical protein